MTILASQPAAPVEPRTSILEANLAALARRSPRVAEAVRRAAPREGLRWTTTDHPGAWSAELEGRALASKRRPDQEAETLAASVDFKKVGAAVVLGFGLGYHVAALTRRAGGHSVVLVYEPDVPLLRSVLEHAEIADWLREGRVLLFTDPQDGGAITASLSGLEALIGLGVTIVEHAPSRPRLNGTGKIFAETLTRVVAACRTQVVTTMTQMEVTFRNFLMNADRYAGMHRCGGVADLKGIAAGLPAVVVSAGPSLARNLDALADPGLRDRCVIIAVQTVLKTMLARGIRPHFVTALDFHEISRRFYEGLTPEDVRGITLVAETKANAAILEAFPGAIRLVGAETLDILLGPELAGRHGLIPPGATVAHLAYYLARHLGCDPVMLVGQDLAFTDGQYYSAGAAIHDVWATELNPFNTLETMEWQRIVRWRGHLHKVEDHLGRTVYTDDQMSTYLAQFERDFLADKERGLTTIDATEGGARKAHTRPTTLKDALAEFTRHDARVPDFSLDTRAHHPNDERALRRRFRERLERIREDTRAVAYLSRQTVDLLKKMSDVRECETRLNPLIDRVHELRDQVEKRREAYNLVHRLNQAGTYKRLRADRALGLDEDLTPTQVQARQIERDTMNVSWFADAADALDRLLGATLDSLDGAPKLTSDPVADAEQEPEAVRATEGPTRVAAVIPVDFERSPLGTPRDLEKAIEGQPIFQRTLTRLARVPGLQGVVLITADPERIKAMIADLPTPLTIDVMHVPIETLRASAESIAASRLWAPTCWRGGIGGMTCYDEVFDPSLAVEAMNRFNYHAALLIGPDWCDIDPELCGEVIARHAQSPSTLPLTFTQAPPGRAGCVIALELARKLAEGREAGDPGASIGALLGFNPLRPRRDPIAEACCIQIPANLRSTHRRFIADHAESDAAEAPPLARPGPTHLILELNTDRGRRDRSPRLSLDHAAEILTQACADRQIVALTLFGRGDPLFHDELPAIIRAARAAGIAGVHVRTDAFAEESEIDALLAARPDVISIDLYALAESTHAALTGTAHFPRTLHNTQRLLDGRRMLRGLPHPWIVPRITRRDAVYDEIEGFYDRALYFAHAGVIDPLPRAIDGQRIAPLPPPRGAVEREAGARMFIRCDGLVIADESDPHARHHQPIGNALVEGVIPVWKRLMERRRDALRDHGHAHPDLRTLH
ncbi:MAG: DUF115 domain-containing protein [Phycisphaerae bacterium]|nr:DUF115 domain-containing protein [Phycisphaerae bacterium]